MFSGLNFIKSHIILFLKQKCIYMYMFEYGLTSASGISSNISNTSYLDLALCSLTYSINSYSVL